MLTRARLAGLWILGSVISPAELEHLDDYSNAIDGQGGTYAPTDPIVIGGDGVTLSGANHHVSGTLTVDNLAVISIASGGTLKAEGTSTADITLKVVAGVALLDVESGAAIRVKSGGALDVYGALTLKNTSGPGSLTAEANTSITLASGSTLTLASGSTCNIANNPTLSGDMTVASGGSVVLQSGADITGASGSSVTLQGALNAYDLKLIGSAAWVQFNTARTWKRAGAILLPLSYAGVSTGPDDPDIWTETSDATTAPCYRTRSATSSGGKSLIEFRDLPIGGEITSVTITTKGTTPPISTTLPTYRIVSWQDSDAAGFTNHSSLTTDTHTAAVFNGAAEQTTINATGTPTVTAGRRYGLLITHPHDGAGQAMRIYEVTMNGTAEEHQL